MVPWVFCQRGGTHALAVAELDPPTGLERLDVLLDHSLLCGTRPGGDEDHAEIDEVKPLLPTRGYGVLHILSQKRYVPSSRGGEVRSVDVCAEEGVFTLQRRGEGGLNLPYPEAVCGADVEDGARGGGEVEGREDEGAGVGLLEAVVEGGQAV